MSAELFLFIRCSCTLDLPVHQQYVSKYLCAPDAPSSADTQSVPRVLALYQTKLLRLFRLHQLPSVPPNSCCSASLSSVSDETFSPPVSRPLMSAAPHIFAFVSNETLSSPVSQQLPSACSISLSVHRISSNLRCAETGAASPFRNTVEAFKRRAFPYTEIWEAFWKRERGVHLFERRWRSVVQVICECMGSLFETLERRWGSVVLRGGKAREASGRRCSL